MIALPFMPPKASLVWNDGRREPTDFVGAIRIHRPWTNDRGRPQETIFVLDEGSAKPGSEWLYRETETIDIAAQMREAAARRRRDQHPNIAPFPGELQGMLPAETDEEFDRRVKIRTGKLP